jgi:hypothetical protein
MPGNNQCDQACLTKVVTGTSATVNSTPPQLPRRTSATSTVPRDALGT